MSEQDDIKTYPRKKSKRYSEIQSFRIDRSWKQLFTLADAKGFEVSEFIRQCLEPNIAAYKRVVEGE